MGTVHKITAQDGGGKVPDLHGGVPPGGVHAEELAAGREVC